MVIALNPDIHLDSLPVTFAPSLGSQIVHGQAWAKWLVCSRLRDTESERHHGIPGSVYAM